MIFLSLGKYKQFLQVEKYLALKFCYKVKMKGFLRLKWGRFHVSNEALKIASLFSSHSGFQQDTRVTEEC